MGPADDRALVRSLVRWFVAGARDLPWRERPLGAPRDPYRVLVSEVMLQQTQAARVAERFEEFVRRFPTVERLAGAGEAEVLALWSGLGYYRRARLLRRAAGVILAEHGGRFPPDAASLAGLPGLGRYTAGAVASLAFGERTPAVDANVTRVVLRLEGRRWSGSDPRTVGLAWSRAADLHQSAPRSASAPSLLNEALIELGAVVCTARNPRCEACPVRAWCAAHARGLTRAIPVPKKSGARKRLYFASVVVTDAGGRVAVTRRPAEGASGLWAGLHEAPTVERADRPPTTREVRAALGLAAGVPRLRRLGSFPFRTTHRDCTFDVYAAAAPARPPESWVFVGPESIGALGLASPQRRILLEMGRVGRA